MFFFIAFLCCWPIFLADLTLTTYTEELPDVIHRCQIKHFYLLTETKLHPACTEGKEGGIPFFQHPQCVLPCLCVESNSHYVVMGPCSMGDSDQPFSRKLHFTCPALLFLIPYAKCKMKMVSWPSSWYLSMRVSLWVLRIAIKEQIPNLAFGIAILNQERRERLICPFSILSAETFLKNSMRGFFLPSRYCLWKENEPAYFR